MNIREKIREMVKQELSEAKGIDTIIKDVTHSIEYYEKPETKKLIAIKVINKLKEKRNGIKNAARKKEYQDAIDRLEIEYKKIREATSTSSVGGGTGGDAYDTPHAFGSDKNRHKSGYKGGHTNPTVSIGDYEEVDDPKLRKGVSKKKLGESISSDIKKMVKQAKANGGVVWMSDSNNAHYFGANNPYERKSYENDLKKGKVYKTVYTNLPESIGDGIRGVIDVLVNSMEHFDAAGGFERYMNKEFGIAKNTAKKIHDAYWKVDAMKRSKWDIKEWTKWLKKFNVTENITEFIQSASDFYRSKRHLYRRSGNVWRQSLGNNKWKKVQEPADLIMKSIKKGDQWIWGKMDESTDCDTTTSAETIRYKKKCDKTRNRNIKEGRYHEFRNNTELTDKQKIGMSMKEVKDTLSELEKLVTMNVRLKTELNIDSRDYWKRTQKSMGKISERLVKLSNKIGQMY